MLSRHPLRRFVHELPYHIFGIIVVLVCVAPIAFVLNASFRDIASYEDYAFSLRGWTFANYTNLLRASNMPRWIANTVAISVAITILTIVVDLMAAFAFAKVRFPGRNVMFITLLSTLMLPFSITLVPTYLLAVRFGLVDTYQGLIIPALSGPFGVYLLRQFIVNIPDALLEAARIDGASTFRIFRMIIVPLCFQPMAVLAIMTFVSNWNSFLWPLLIAQSVEKQTLTVGIATTHMQFAQNIGGLTAGAMLSLIPMIILFFVFQRFFLQGVTAGALKG